MAPVATTTKATRVRPAAAAHSLATVAALHPTVQAGASQLMVLAPPPLLPPPLQRLHLLQLLLQLLPRL